MTAPATDEPTTSSRDDIRAAAGVDSPVTPAPPRSLMQAQVLAMRAQATAQVQVAEAFIAQCDAFLVMLEVMQAQVRPTPPKPAAPATFGGPQQ